jgi:hypothetical protein
VLPVHDTKNYETIGEALKGAIGRHKTVAAT